MIPDAATNAASRTVPIIPNVPAARAGHPMTGLVLAPGPQVVPAASTPVVPAAPSQAASPAAAATSVPAARTPATSTVAAGQSSSANAYFDWFQACRCGHSSAWHGGAFGAAWRSGHQVQGPCEAGASEGLAQRCPCSHFAAAH